MNRVLKYIVVVVVAIVVVLYEFVFQDILLSDVKDSWRAFLNPYLNTKISIGSCVAWGFLFILTVLTIFSDLHNPRKQKESQENSLQKLIRKYTNKESSKSHVIATQLYKYNFKRARDTIKLEYQSGYVLEKERINAIIQDYYELPRDYFSRLKEGIDNFKYGDEQRGDLQINQFLDDCLNEISQIRTVDQVTPTLAIKYSLVMIAMQYMDQLTRSDVSAGDFINYSQITNLVPPDVEAKLAEILRTGIMRAILCYELEITNVYRFEHKGDSDKKGRTYTTLITENGDDRFIFLVCFDGSIQRVSNYGKILKKAIEHLEKQINKDIGLTNESYINQEVG